MSSNQQILSFVGSVVGSYFGPVGSSVGSYIGGYVGASFDKLPDVHGPRLEDRKIQTSAYGVPIPLTYGTVRIAGNLIWFKDNMLTEVASTDETGGKSGQPAQSTTIYSYYATFSLLLSGTQSRSVRRIWAGAMLLYDGGLIDSVTPNFGLTFYRGAADQLPDPLIEAEKGVGNTPAFRGKSYLVFDSMPIERTGWPVNFTVELVGEGDFSYAAEELGTTSSDAWLASTQRLDGNIIAAQQIGATLRLRVLDQQTGASLLSVDHTMTADGGNDSVMCYVPPLSEVWIGGGPEGVMRFDATTLAHLGDIYNFGGSSRMVWDPVRQRVFHRPNAPWLRAGGQNVVLAGAGSVVDIINAEDAGYIGLDYVVGFETMDAIVGNVPSNGSQNVCAAAYDPMRRHYVVFASDNTCRTATDSTSPVVTLQSTGSFTDSGGGPVLYDASTDCVLKVTQLAGRVQFTAFDAETFDVLVHKDEIFSGGLRLGVMDVYPDTTETGRVFVLGYYAAGAEYQPWVINYFGSTLAACVSDLCDRSGLDVADIDVSDLTQDLRGYMVSSVDSARPAIEQLAKVFSFNGCEEDDKIVFKMRGAGPIAVIARDECGAVEGGDSPIAAIITTRAQQLDLPQFCMVTSPDPARDFEADTQQSQRQAANAGKVAQFSTAVVMTADERVRLANLFMYDAWTSRTGLKFNTDARHDRLMPGDVVTLDGRRTLLLGRTSGGASIDWEAVSDDASVLTQYGIGVSGDYPHQVPPQSVPTTEILLDMALLSDAEDTPGAYVAAYGVVPHWRGGVIYRSADSGASWTRVATFPQPGSSAGTAVDALGDFVDGNVFDETNTLTVRMRNGTPYSATRDALLTGSNALAIRSGDGWEVLQYRDVALNGDGSYSLSGLLRGRRGTEWSIADHAVGDDVVLLSMTTLRDEMISSSEIGVEQLCKPVSIGSTLSDTASKTQTIDAERLKPWSPCHFRVNRDEATGDAALSWKRRTRLACRYTGTGGVYVPLGEETELYELEIMTPGFIDVVRTVTGLTSPAYDYTFSQQEEDGQIHGDPISVRIYQISAIVGRGHPLEARAGGLASPIYVPEVPPVVATSWALHFVGQAGAPDGAPLKIDEWSMGGVGSHEVPYDYMQDGSLQTQEDPILGNGVASSSGDWPFSDANFAFGMPGMWVSNLDVGQPYPILGFYSTDGVSADPYYSITTDSFAGVDETNTGPRNWDLYADGVLIHRIRDQPVFDPGTRAYTIRHTGLNFYRLNITQTANGSAPRISKLALYAYGTNLDKADDPDFGFGDSSGATDESHQGDAAFHGSGWEASSGPVAWLRYEFNGEHSIGSYGIRVDAFVSSVAPKSWTLECSPNGVDWTIVDSRENESFEAGVMRTFTLSRRIEFLPA